MKMWFGTDYWQMSDDALVALAKKYHMMVGPGYSGYLEREYLIGQLVARDSSRSNRFFAIVALAVSILSLGVSIATIFKG